MTLLYRSKWTFTDLQYCRSLLGLAFSPDGAYLAYGSKESLCIVDVTGQHLEFVLRARTTPKGTGVVTALAWLPCHSFDLICTFSDGLIARITQASDRLLVTGIESTVSSITCISPNNAGNKFAIGADSGITIWSAVGNRTWKADKVLGPPQRYADNVREPVEVVGMHWLETKTDRLIVVYKAHGVQLWDVSSGNVVSNILTTSAAIGCSSLSPDCRTLVLAMQRGYTIHQLETRVPLVSISHKLNAPGPVLFLHNGSALLGASRKGEVCLWASSNGEKLQDMKQNGLDHWRYLTAHDTSNFLIATATSKKIVLWEATEGETPVDNPLPKTPGGPGVWSWWLAIGLSVVGTLLFNAWLESKLSF